MPASFPPSARLRDHRSFVAVQKTGRRVSLPHVTLLALPNTLGHDRLGVIASRKFGGAVVRNRAKRRLREMFRREPVSQSSRPDHKGLDVVAIPKRGFTEDAFDALSQEFRAGLRRLRG